MDRWNVNECIEKAKTGQSNLTQGILDLEGMSSLWIRHLLNNLVRNCNYLEIGLWHGSTFISAVYGNKVNAYGIDNWCKYNENESRTNFLKNCAHFNIDYKLIEEDSYTINLSKITDKIDIYFYDGNHSTEYTCKALTYYYDVLNNEFLFIVDDYRWDEVKEGVICGIEKCNLKVIDKWELESEKINDENTWWSGLGIFILRKDG